MLCQTAFGWNLWSISLDVQGMTSQILSDHHPLKSSMLALSVCQCSICTFTAPCIDLKIQIYFCNPQGKASEGAGAVASRCGCQRVDAAIPFCEYMMAFILCLNVVRDTELSAQRLSASRACVCPLKVPTDPFLTVLAHPAGGEESCRMSLRKHHVQVAPCTLSSSKLHCQFSNFFLPSPFAWVSHACRTFRNQQLLVLQVWHRKGK
jgi:hypothetical protein